MNESYLILPVRCLVSVFLAMCLPSAIGQITSSELVINEILASNSSAYSPDSGSSFPDVIELKNLTASDLDLTGYGLSDDESAPPWVLPAGTTIPAGGFLLVLANGNAMNLEADFKLSAGGEQVHLTGPSGTTIDLVTFERQRTDVSYGRLLDGSLAFMPNVTIGSDNDDSGAFASLVKLPNINQRSGIYQDPVTVELEAEPGIEIRYTLDGSNPTQTSPLYTGPITINAPAPLPFPEAIVKGVVLKAVAFEGSLKSLVASRSFIFNVSHDLPVILLTADNVIDRGLEPVELFTRDEIYGRFSILGRVRFDFLETNGSLAISQYTDFRESGRNSRSIPPLNGKLFARAKYGNDRLEHRFFPEKVDQTSFTRILLRNTSQDFSSARLRDGIFSRFISTDGIVDYPYEGYRPCVLYLNGEYLGHMNIREDDDQEYAEQYFDYQSPAVSRRRSGGGNIFSSNKNTFPNPTASDAIDRLNSIRRVDEALFDDSLRDSMDLHRFDRFVTIWGTRDSNETERNSFHDFDSAFKIFAQTFEDDFTPPVTWSEIDWVGNLERGGDDIRYWEAAVQATAAYLNLFADADRMDAIIDAATEEIRSEMTDTIEFYLRRKAKVNRPLASDFNAHKDLSPESMAEWQESIAFIKLFPQSRLVGALDAIRTTHNLPAIVNLDIASSDTSMGEVRVHGYKVTPGRESGEYISTFPVRLEARPRAGHRFVRWDGAVNETDQAISPSFTTDGTIRALFEPVGLPVATASHLAISEIFYNPAGTEETSEFIELLNISDEEVDLTGVSFIQGVRYTFPADSTLAAGARIVLTPSDYKGNLSNDGEEITYLDANGDVIEILTYSDGDPWPEAADGAGFSLVRIDPTAADSSTSTAWRLSTTAGGNPGSDDGAALTDMSAEGLLRYAFGTQGPELNGEVTQSGVTLTFRKMLNADDVSVTLFQSPDLSPLSWVTVPIVEILSEDVPLLGREMITVGPLVTTPNQMFYRLEVKVR